MKLHAHNIESIEISNLDFKSDDQSFRIISIKATDKNGTEIVIDLFTSPGFMPDINLSEKFTPTSFMTTMKSSKSES